MVIIESDSIQDIVITSDQVAAHEDHGELIAVLVITPPDGVVLFVELVPEVWDRLFLVVVGVEPFEVIHVPCSLRHGCEGVLGLLDGCVLEAQENN